MPTTDNDECTWDLFKSIPSLDRPGLSVLDETGACNELQRPHSIARLVDRRRARVPVSSMGFSMHDRLELLKLSVQLATDCTVTGLDHPPGDGPLVVTGIHCRRQGAAERIDGADGDPVFLQNGSMTDASSLGSMASAPEALTKLDSGGWTLWETLARGRPEFGRPAVFNSCIAQSLWQSFTATLKNPAFFDEMQRFTTNEAGIEGLVTFKDSNWLLSIVLAHQPHFRKQPADVQVFWGYALFPDRIGNVVAQPMADCNGAEILQELRDHLRLDLDTLASANCIPCRMPYIASMFMPRHPGDRPQPVPPNSKNFAFVSQFVEIPGDVVFTVEYSVRAAQMAVYRLLDIPRAMPPVTPHDPSLHTQFEALVKAFQ